MLIRVVAEAYSPPCPCSRARLFARASDSLLLALQAHTSDPRAPNESSCHRFYKNLGARKPKNGGGEVANKSLLLCFRASRRVYRGSRVPISSFKKKKNATASCLTANVR